MVYLFLADGFEEIEALATVDILRRADIEVKTVSISDDYEVRGTHDIIVSADILFKDIDSNPDLIILPGGLPGTTNLRNFSPLCDMIVRMNEEGKLLAAICAAPSVFGELGILEGKKATCYPGFEETLKGAEILKDAVVHDDNVITSRGAGTAHLFAFRIVEILKDINTAEKLKAGMMYE